MDEKYRELCKCPWHLGLGPEIHCPAHGRPDLLNKEELKIFNEQRRMIDEKRRNNGLE